MESQEERKDINKTLIKEGRPIPLCPPSLEGKGDGLEIRVAHAQAIVDAIGDSGQDG
jgi:hypothetical protein